MKVIVKVANSYDIFNMESQQMALSWRSSRPQSLRFQKTSGVGALRFFQDFLARNHSVSGIFVERNHEILRDLRVI